MQAKSFEPGTHSGVARYFGTIFLFQAATALFLALSEQTFDGYVSSYLAVLAVICMTVAICFCIPAAAVVAVPEPDKNVAQAIGYIVSTAFVLMSAFVFAPHVSSAPDIPYINLLLRREILGGMVGGVLVVGVACAVRMGRNLKGKNGAYILVCGLVLMTLFGMVWAYLEPLCVVSSAMDKWRKECPLPQVLDHNFLMTFFMMVSNVLTAEGVLRLMAAGSGVEDYVEIVPTGIPPVGVLRSGVEANDEIVNIYGPRVGDGVPDYFAMVDAPQFSSEARDGQRRTATEGDGQRRTRTDKNGQTAVGGGGGGGVLM